MSVSELGIIPTVTIDNKGVFKYILIEVEDKSGDKRVFVRGSEKFEFHKENFVSFFSELKKYNIDKKQYRIKCPGGGRISISDKQTMSIYGYSKSYGLGDHLKAKELIKQESCFRDFIIETSNEGY